MGEASLGDQARLYIWPCRWMALGEFPAPQCADTLSAEDFKQAFFLYLAQAAIDEKSPNKVGESLYHAISLAFTNSDLFKSLMQDADTRHLLLTYLFQTEIQTYHLSYMPRVDSQMYMDELEQLLASQPDLDLGRGGAKLAIISYRYGRYGQAQHFADQASGPAAAWVRAKLALQRGDEATALKEYAQVFEDFKEPSLHNTRLATADEAMLFAETGVLAMARSDYFEAMRLFFTSAQKDQQLGEMRAEVDYNDHSLPSHEALLTNSNGSWFSYEGDASYIAERVLTTDELKRFVDQYTPALVEQDECQNDCWVYPLRLRWLLARRLMRENRYDEAMSYFPRTDDPRLKTLYISNIKNMELAELAKQYTDELKASQSFWQSDVSRAEHLFNAAVIARRYGLELMGYEQSPDKVQSDGSWIMDVRTPRANDKWVNADEIKRYEATSPVGKPFQYRYTAINLAEQAADKVPARSQAFSAILCQASFWELRSSTENRERLYARYLREGALVPWAFHKSQCPEPDFNKARYDVWKFRFLTTLALVREHRIWSGIAIILLGTLLGLWIIRRILNSSKVS